MTLTAPVKDARRQDTDLNALLTPHPEHTLFVYAKSASMIKAFIPPEALLVIDKAVTPKNGDVVIASLKGKFIVRFLKKNNFTCWLCGAGKKYSELKITPAMNITIWGVVTQIVSVPNSSAYV